jgi:hypothetical protein
MVTQYSTKLIAFRKKLIGTTENITNDAMKTHIFTALSNSYETTIQILEQRIPNPTAQQCMDAICEYAERTTLTKKIGDASTTAALYSHGGNRGRGGQGAGRGGGVAEIPDQEIAHCSIRRKLRKWRFRIEERRAGVAAAR